MTRLHPDDIQAIIAGVLAGLSAPQPAAGLTVAQQAIQLARQGKIEESKALLKAYSKRRAV